MSRVPAVLLWTSLLVLVACGPRVPPNNAPGDPKPPPSSSPEPTNTGASRVDPEDPKAGTNTNRPDSIKDVKPGADGATNYRSSAGAHATAFATTPNQHRQSL